MEASEVKMKTDFLYWAYPNFCQSGKYLHLYRECQHHLYLAFWFSVCL